MIFKNKLHFMKTLSFLIFTFILFDANASDDNSLDSFTLKCTDVETHSFRHEFDMLRKKLSIDSQWNNEEKFNAFWNFQYDKDRKQLNLNEKEMPYDLKALSVLVVEHNDASLGKSIWTYALYPLLNKAVATQINGYTTPMAGGIKGRVVELSCFDQ